MRIIKIVPLKNYILQIEFDDGKKGIIDISPYLQYEAFEPLRNEEEFLKISNGGYYIEWECGADLSIDTISEKLQAA